MKAKNKSYIRNYVVNLNTALFSNYSSALPSYVMNELKSIYTEETGETDTSNMNCSVCALGFLKRLAKVYFSEYPEDIETNYREKWERMKK